MKVETSLKDRNNKEVLSQNAVISQSYENAELERDISEAQPIKQLQNGNGPESRPEGGQSDMGRTQLTQDANQKRTPVYEDLTLQALKIWDSSLELLAMIGSGEVPVKASQKTDLIFDSPCVRYDVSDEYRDYSGEIWLNIENKIPVKISLSRRTEDKQTMKFYIFPDSEYGARISKLYYSTILKIDENRSLVMTGTIDPKLECLQPFSYTKFGSRKSSKFRIAHFD